MLDIKHVTKVFFPGTVNEKVALEDISLHVDEGDVVSVIGSNGSGKSTLFNMIAGTFPVTSGTITLDGKDITKMPEYRRAFEICGGAPATRGYAGKNVGAALFVLPELLSIVGSHISRSYAVYVDVILSPFVGERHGYAADSRLGSRVRRHPYAALIGEHGSYVYYFAARALLYVLPGNRLREEKDRL